MPALHLMRQCSIDHRYDDLLLEMEYNIVSKFEEHPELLQIFFMKSFIAPKNVSRNSIAAGKFTSTSSLNTSPSRKPSMDELSKIAETMLDPEFLLFDVFFAF
jgi:hypothetical protein